MYVSFDDGDHWQSLMLESADDVVSATSRSRATISSSARTAAAFWVLDDYSMLRQLTPRHRERGRASLQAGRRGARAPQRRRGHAVPARGAARAQSARRRDHRLLARRRAPSGDVTLDVLDSSGAVVRHMSSDPIAPVPEAARPPHPNFWVAPPQPLPDGRRRATATNWDLRYDAPPAFTHTFEINANPGQTPASPEGPLVLPGTYTVRLTVNGKSHSEKVAVANDPRSPANSRGA